MYRSRLTNLAVGLLIAVVLATNGCTFVPQWALPSASDTSHTAKLAAAVESFNLAESELPPTTPEVKTARNEDGTLQSKSSRATLPENSESPELKAFIAELEKYPEIDLADRNELLQQLHQTKPNLLEAVIRQYRANLAFQRQRKEKDRELADTKATAEAAKAETSPATPPAATPLAAAESKPPGASPFTLAKLKDKPEKPVETVDLAAAIAVQGALPLLPDEPDSSAKPAVNPPRLSIADRLMKMDRSSDSKPESQVVAASFETQPPADWRDQLKVAIEALESSVNQAPDSPEEISDHARLRLLCLAAQRRDEALRPIPTLDSEMTEFWSKEVFGLAALLDTEMISDPVQRLSEAKVHFEEAVNHLGESAPLVVRNLAFITKVVSYGVYTTFESCEFKPGQRVGLYVEMENFTSKEVPQGFHTSLKSSYEITDNRGQRVAVDEFLPNRETCRNRRRDYFVFYEFSMPERIYPGEYTLQLTVTDVNSQKVGQSKVQFYIKDEND
jgi:hypothetical protein